MLGTLRALADIARKEDKKLYLVGGFVRDALRGTQSRDLDLVVSEEAAWFARRAAFSLQGSYDPLDSVAQLSRVRIIADDGLPLVLDFSQRRGGRIEDDLRHRDFTINAMAVSLDDYLNEQDWQGRICDPCGGKDDLATGILRLTAEEVLRDDPVRLLRSVRFLHKLSLQFDPETVEMLRRDARFISTALGSKLAIEFFKLLSGSRAAESLRVLHEDLGVLAAFFAPFSAMAATKSDGEDILTHGLYTCELLEKILLGSIVSFPEILPKLSLHLQKDVAEQRPRLAYLKLACILHDVGKIDGRSGKSGQAARFFSHELAGEAYVASLVKRLKLSGEEGKFLSVLVCNHSRPLYAGKEAGYLPAQLRFFHQFRDGVPELVLLALANLASGREADGERVARLTGLLEQFFAGAAADLPEPTISAQDVMEFFKLPPARPVGQLLEAAYAAQLAGKVTRRSEALALISKLLEQAERRGREG